MLTRKEIVELAEAYSEQETILRQINRKKKSIDDLRSKFDRELAEYEDALYSERVNLSTNEKKIFNLEVKNGNFDTDGRT